MELQSDKSLLAKLSSGNDQAFVILFKRHWKQLYSFAYNLTKDEELSKDILQNVFMYVWTNCERMHSEDSLLPYLFTVAKNGIITAFRKDKIRLQGQEVLLKTIQPNIHIEENIHADEIKNILNGEIARMPANMQKCFKLSRYDEKSIRDIAAELHLSEQTVKNNISEALKRLRFILNKESVLYSLVIVLESVTNL